MNILRSRLACVRLLFVTGVVALLLAPEASGQPRRPRASEDLRARARSGDLQDVPVILYGREYWDKLINLQFLADEGVIGDHHLDLVEYAETPQAAWDLIARHYRHDGEQHVD